MIQEKISQMIRPAPSSRFTLSRLFSPPPEDEYITLRIRAPRYFFLRATVFIDDIRELSRGRVHLQLPDLISLLYDNFLAKIRTGVDMKAHLHSLRKTLEYFEPPLELSQKTDNHWALTSSTTGERQKKACLDLAVRKATAYRGEVFLYDLEHVDASFSMSVEELVTLLFMEFVEAIRIGNVEKIMKEILHFIESQQDDLQFY
ncbi:hypothetical protein ACFQ88_22535 [Paenibacillus sp. NPDC056579]|uniref:hypothetical protein n=1 Tax=Paenibacillus sp. NPDC056579 TaxID=3345871 RepID=UPI00368AE4DD